MQRAIVVELRCHATALISKIFLQEHLSIRVPEGLDPDQDRQSVSPDLGPNCLQKLSAEDKSWRYTVARKELLHNSINTVLFSILFQWEHPNLIVVVYDCTNETSFNSCQKWLERVRNQKPEVHTPGKANLKFFLFPLTRPCFTGIGWSVGNLFF